MRILFQYISRRVIQGVLMAFLIVTSIILLIDFVESSRNLDGADDLSAGQIFLLTALKAPQLIEQTIPFIVLFGVMGALYTLNRRSELIVMRASGLSAWRFLAPAILVAGFLGVLWSTVLNPIAAQAMNWHSKLADQFLGTVIWSTERTDIWLREGTPYEQTVIYAASFDLIKRTLYDVEFTVFQPDDSGDLIFSGRYDAKNARLLSTNYWELTDVIENQLAKPMQYTKTLTLPTTITQQQLQYSYNQNSQFSFWHLPNEIKRLSQAGFSTASLRLQYSKLLALPVLLIGMAIIAAAVSMRLTREGGTLRLLMLGGICGFGVFFSQNMLEAFGGAGVIPTTVAAWFVPILVLLSGLAYLSWLEDG